MDDADIKALDKKMCCIFHAKTLRPVDKARRVQILTMFTDLMVFDLLEDEGGSNEADFEECLDEFLQREYNCEAEEDSIQQIAKNMMKIRRELVDSAINSHTLQSKELDKWRKFNAEQQAKQPEYQKLYEKYKEEFK